MTWQEDMGESCFQICIFMYIHADAFNNGKFTEELLLLH